MQMETDFHRKIILEYEKNQELAASFNKLRDESNAKLRKTAGYLEDTIESMESDFRQQIDNRRERIQQLVASNESLRLEFIEYCRQERAQFERQLVQLRLDYEKRFLHEQEVNSKWRNEAGVVAKKYGQTIKENSRFREDFLAVEQANRTLQSLVDEAGHENQELKANVSKLQAQLQEKVREIESFVRKVTASEEKQVAVEIRLGAVQTQQVERENEIRRRSEELRSLSTELESLAKNNADLERQLSSTKQRQEGLAIEVKAKSVEIHRVKTYLARVIADVHLLNELILKPEQLKKAVVKLYAK